jgi:hypothetical protein
MARRKASTILRDTAESMREGGFTPAFNSVNKPGCGCFLYHARTHGDEWSFARGQLLDVLGLPSLGEMDLRGAGWCSGPKATQDAVAVCEIAADLCEAEGH